MEQHPLGLLMPHPPAIVAGIGNRERKTASATVKACERASEIVAEFQPDTLIIISPHGPVFRDAVALMATPTLSGDFSRFGAPSVHLSVPVDLALAKAVLQETKAACLPLISIDAAEAKQYQVRPELDHGALVPLWYLQRPDRPPQPILHLTYGMLPGAVLYEIGQAVRRASDRIGRRIAIIASGDLSHRLLESGPYGFDPAGPPLDQKIVNALAGDWTEKQDSLVELYHFPQHMLNHAAECGLRSLQIMIGFLDPDAVVGECLSYEGPFGVGYAVCIFRCPHFVRPSLLPMIREKKDGIASEPDQKNHPYPQLARQTLAYYLRKGSRLMKPSNLPEVLFDQRKACFVSIKKNGDLRGCIGTLQPTTENLATEIIGNALSAGLHDPRFPPVALDELDELTFSVDVLSESEPATRAMLDPARFGVIVRYGNRSGVLLPDLEGVDTVERQLAIALQKAGIRSSDPYTIERFTVDRYHEVSP